MTIQDLLKKADSHWDDADALIDIGTELESRTRLPEARRILERALGLAPKDFPEAYATLAFTHFRDNASTAEKGEMALIQGLEITDSDYLKAWYVAFIDDPPARDYFIEYLGNHADPRLRIILGHALLWQGMHDESQRVLSEAIKGLGPEYMDILPKELTVYCSSLVWLKGAKPDLDIEQRVIPILLALQERYPDVYMNHASEITAWQVLKNWNNVIDASKKTLAKFPDEETTMLAMALAYDKLGKPHHALHLLAKAIGIKPSFARARMVSARILESLGELELAKELIYQIPEANPQYAVGIVHTAIWAFEHGDKQSALEFYRRGYADLKPFEKSQFESHPIVKQIAEEQKSTILLNVLQ
ncbi:MAG: tetratricopeptide repeat protein [Ignavibacteria bacterium]|jgi:tetratricopeptide (TPR) repeat protein